MQAVKLDMAITSSCGNVIQTCGLGFFSQCFFFLLKGRIVYGCIKTCNCDGLN